eukprot:TRINITY_DN63222_c0_g1_i1.p1 TRINITY_DN63222_c0_g1~~TRINITY_DN63222_c0_g1_i1.p1  ORF type:complete len:231 (-),score=33.40 TRINITY_DN63222_c0_g1_i1:120-812(-)
MYSPRPTRTGSRSPSPPRTPVKHCREIDLAIELDDFDLANTILHNYPMAVFAPVRCADGLGLETPLVKASRHLCSMFFVQKLLDCGACPNELPGSRDASPLVALAQGRCFVHGPDGMIQQEEADARFFSWKATSPRPDEDRCRADIAERLLKAGADPDWEDVYGKAALHYAELRGSSHLVRVLQRASGLKVCQIILPLWRRRAVTPPETAPSFLSLPETAQSCICGFLLP